MARGDAPALQRRRGRDNPIPPQERNRIGLGQSVALEIAHDFCPLPLVTGDRLPDEKRVKKPVSRPGIVDRDTNLVNSIVGSS